MEIKPTAANCKSTNTLSMNQRYFLADSTQRELLHSRGLCLRDEAECLFG